LHFPGFEIRQAGPNAAHSAKNRTEQEQAITLPNLINALFLGVFGVRP
jgi:hypothetical protein